MLLSIISSKRQDKNSIKIRESYYKSDIKNCGFINNISRASSVKYLGL